ncbi:hypothetical protein Ahy_A06g025859 [Arachis hypogaea]|uniref:Uncharacterized protein n=1 Tax=Arachis hypogaea TaxID=3818 RepID=A0A445CIU9_ARAHY|nr:hypothetical protein Ahy_A06g025859 [Arachis hypogaea]
MLSLGVTGEPEPTGVPDHWGGFKPDPERGGFMSGRDGFEIHLLVAAVVSLAIAIAFFKVLPTFTLAKIQELKDLEEEAKRNQSLKSLLLSPSGDFVIFYYGNKIAVFEFKSKMVELYFSLSSYERCTNFIFGLVEFYDKLRSDEESFEIVMIPLDE